MLFSAVLIATFEITFFTTAFDFLVAFIIKFTPLSFWEKYKRLRSANQQIFPERPNIALNDKKRRLITEPALEYIIKL